VIGRSSDDSLVNLLASLAAETSHNMTHQDNDNDSDDFIPSQHVLPLSTEDRREIAEETLEMSQRVWDEEDIHTDTEAATADDNMYVLQSFDFNNISVYFWNS